MAGIKPVGLDKILIGGIGQELNRWYYLNQLAWSSSSFRMVLARFFITMALVGKRLNPKISSALI